MMMMMMMMMISYVRCLLFELFQFTFICKCECDVIVGYWILSHRGILSEMDSGYYPTQMQRRDWSDSFLYVTIIIHVILLS